MVVSGNRFNGKHYHEDNNENLCSPLSHMSVSKTDKMSSAQSPAEYCSWNIKSETVTPGLPGGVERDTRYGELALRFVSSRLSCFLVNPKRSR